VVSYARGRVAPSTVLLVASFGAFLAFLDATIVNVAFPSIQKSFPDASIGSLSWVLNAYNIVFAAFLVVCGRLADLIGRRRAYVSGIALFTLASGWCGAAWNLESLVAGRVVQAFGAAMLVPASLAIVVEAFSGERRAHAIGLWGAAAAVAAGLGPPLGGALVHVGGWRWAFLVNLPFGVAALLVSRRTLVESRAPGRRTVPDLVGALLLAAALALLTLGIIKAPDWGWGSWQVLGAFAVALVLGAMFVRSSLRHPAPVVDPALVRIPSVRTANVATVLAGGGFYAYLLTNILWLQYVWGYDVLRAGLALVPGAVVAAVVAAVLGPLTERIGHRVLVVPGALVWAGAYLWYHQEVGLTPAFWTEWLPGQVLSGIGVGATLPLLASAALAAVPGGRYATASALTSSARQLGGVLGISLLVLIVGTPTPETVAGALRDGWALSIGAFVLVAVVALLLGRTDPVPEHEEGTDQGALVLRPEATPPSPPRGSSSEAPHAVGLDSIPLLASLTDDARQALTDASRTVEVSAGEWLFREGDAAGSLYVVSRGRLEVMSDGRMVRELAAGAVLGELALLTGEPRSADVRARRDATLLEVTRESFDTVINADVAATRTVLSQVAHQLRTATAPEGTDRPESPSVVAVVGLHPDSGVEEVASTLLVRLSLHLSAVDPGRVDAAGLARAERDHDRVVLVADGERPDEGRTGEGRTDEGSGWRDFCLRHADAVVLVARSTSPVPADPFPGDPLRGHPLPGGSSPRPSAQPEVVLLGPAPAPAQRAEWTTATDAWQLTLVQDDPVSGLRALGDRLAGHSLGLVLAGGGARAFAHIGVLRELEDAGVRVDRVAGSSVGAILAAIHASGKDGSELEELCYTELVRRKPFSDWTLPRTGRARGARVRAALGRALGADTVIEGLPRQLHVVSTDLVSRTRAVHRRGGAVDAVAASCRLPVLFPPIPRDDGRLLLDGGVLDNLPVDLLMERDEGPVVAVNISMGGGGGGHGSRTGKPRVPALGETLLRVMMIGSGGAVERAHRAGAAVVTPASMGVGLLEFHQFDRMVAAGREAARALLADGFLAQLEHGVPLDPPAEPRPPLPRRVPANRSPAD
jgi:NTE family protein